MGARITLAGESLIAQKQAAREALKIERFIFANVPGLAADTPVDPAAPKPPAAQTVYSASIPAENAGYVNPNQVVYSVQVGSDVGDWDFNWIGLESAEGVLFAVAYVPLQQKRRNIPPLQVGNNITRNFLVVFDGAQELTGITIDASTWQHDFTVRLKGIDERERLSNRDIFGRACFFGSGLQLEKVGSTYQLKPGGAYIEGIRVERSAALPVVPPALPTTAWLDVALQRELNDVVTSAQVVWGTGKTDYTDSVGVRHYLVPLADLVNSTTITDRRTVEPISSPLIQQFAFRSGDYPNLRARATTKDDVGLGNLPNAKSDDPATNSSNILATTAALQALLGSVVAAETGQIAAFAMATPPAGWLKCNGAAVSRTTYAKLFARIGTVFGAGDGSTTFNLPDARGEFLRGWDDGRGVDAGRVLGSAQAHLLGSHTHTASSAAGGAHTHTASTGAGGSHTHTASTASDGAHTHTVPGSVSSSGGSGSFDGNSEGASFNKVTSSAGAHTHAVTVDAVPSHTHTVTVDAAANHNHAITVDAAGGAETRPRNLAVLFCIRY
ncbi:phage tail-collar fiber domain-containing protein [Pseudomonas indica]|uniref:phage tail-collar fiber domain-containing protein n=1 Tax=Pseudomonas indica TaxID=137658 RepID=UPI003FCF7367